MAGISRGGQTSLRPCYGKRTRDVIMNIKYKSTRTKVILRGVWSLDSVNLLTSGE
jgi:hypothetical protein